MANGELNPKRRRWFLSTLILVVLVVIAGITMLLINQPTTERYLAEGRRQLEVGNYRAAVIDLKNAVKTAPNNAEGRLLLATVLLRIGDMASAEKEAQYALKLGAAEESVIDILGPSLLQQGKAEALLQVLQPGNREKSSEAAIHIWRGYAFLSRRDRPSAKAAFTQAIELAPQDPRGHVGLARTFIEQRQVKAAEDSVDVALAITPHHADALAVKGELQRQTGRIDQAEKTFSTALAAEPRNQWALIGRAVLLVDQNKLEAADQDITALLKVNPGHPIGSYLYALANARRGNIKSGAEQLERLGDSIENYAPNLYLLGALEHRLGRYAQAEARIEKYLLLIPTDIRARHLLADTLIRRNATDKAISVLQPAVDQGPEDPVTYSLLATANLKNHNFNEADKWLDKAAAVPEQSSRRHLQLAYSRFQLGQSDEALQELESALEQDQNSLQARMALALGYLRKGDIEKALTTAKELQQRFPDNPIPFNLLGAIHMAGNNMAEARNAFEQALKVNPDFGPAIINLARLDERLGDFSKAEQRYKGLLAKEPNTMEAYLGLAQVAAQRNAPADAISWLEKARTIDPKAIRPGLAVIDLYLREGKNERAVQVARELQSKSPDNPQALDALARTQFAVGDVESSIQTFRQVVSLSPKDPNAHYRLGKALQQTGDKAGSLTAFHQAISIDPDHLPSTIELVEDKLSAGHKDAAVKTARDWADARPNLPAGKMLLGDTLAQAGQLQQAIEAYSQAQDLKPTTEAQIALAKTWNAIGDHGKAISMMEDWLAQHPEDAKVRLSLADMHLRLHKYKEASAQYELLLKAEPNNPLVLNNLAWAYGELGDDRAIATAEQAMRAAPNSPSVADTLGYLLVRSGDASRGIEILKEAYRKAPKSHAIRYHLATGLAKIGDRQQAKVLLREVLAASGSFEDRLKAEQLLNELGG